MAKVDDKHVIGREPCPIGASRVEFVVNPSGYDYVSPGHPAVFLTHQGVPTHVGLIDGLHRRRRDPSGPNALRPDLFAEVQLYPRAREMGRDGEETAAQVSERIPCRPTGAQLAFQRGASLPLGTMAPLPDCSVGLSFAGDALGHIAVLGQSGSGKSTALRSLLRLALAARQDLRILIIDPNRDFSDPARLLPVAQAELVCRIAEAIGEGVTRQYGLRPSQLDPEAIQALLPEPPREFRTQRFVLRLLRDALAGEDQLRSVSLLQLIKFVAQRATGEEGALQAALLQAFEQRAGQYIIPDKKSALEELPALLGANAEPLGVWAPTGRQVTESPGEFVGGTRVQVLDFEGMSRKAMFIVAHAALRDLWSRHLQRAAGPPPPTLVVVDEAHYLAGANPEGEVQRMTSEIICTLATQGRKYNLFLVLSTQRPTQLHPDVLSQVQNLLLKRITSKHDIDYLEGALTSVTPGLVHLLPSLTKERAIVAGPMIAMPALVDMANQQQPATQGRRS